MGSVIRQENESLLDWMARQVGCEYLSDLRKLTDPQRRCLAAALEPVQAREQDLRQWNDALNYLFHDGAQSSASAAREAILRQLHNDHDRQQ